MPRHKIPPLQLLESRSRKTPSGCVEWIGPKNRDGYGVFNSSVMGRTGAHRASWIIHYGKIPDGKWVLHSCHNPACVNPEHLKLGDHHANMKDRKLNGKYPSGEDHFSSVIPNDIAIAIWHDKRTCRVIAESYNVNRDVVQRIRQGQTYVEATGGGRSPFQRSKGQGSWVNRP
jgi:hypothetical protein